MKKTQILEIETKSVPMVQNCPEMRFTNSTFFRHEIAIWQVMYSHDSFRVLYNAIISNTSFWLVQAHNPTPCYWLTIRPLSALSCCFGWMNIEAKIIAKITANWCHFVYILSISLFTIPDSTATLHRSDRRHRRREYLIGWLQGCRRTEERRPWSFWDSDDHTAGVLWQGKW